MERKTIERYRVKNSRHKLPEYGQFVKKAQELVKEAADKVKTYNVQIAKIEAETEDFTPPSILQGLHHQVAVWEKCLEIREEQLQRITGRLRPCEVKKLSRCGLKVAA